MFALFKYASDIQIVTFKYTLSTYQKNSLHGKI